MVASYVFSGSGSGKRPCLDPSHTRQRTSDSTDILSGSGTRSARDFDHVFAPEYRGVFAAEMELEPATSQGSDWAYVGSRVGRQAMRDQNLDVEDWRCRSLGRRSPSASRDTPTTSTSLPSSTPLATVLGLPCFADLFTVAPGASAL